MQHSIEFIRFHLPNGRQTTETIEVGDAEYAAYKVIRSAGFRLTSEILATGDISLCVEDPMLGDFDIKLCPNGPAVPVAVSTLLLRFNLKSAEAWRAEMS